MGDLKNEFVKMKEQIKSVEAHNNNLQERLDEMKLNLTNQPGHVNKNKNNKDQKIPEKTVIDCGLLLFFDSNGKFLRPDWVNKEVKCQHVFAAKIEDINRIVKEANFISFPEKILINVGINNIDNEATDITAEKYRKLFSGIQSRSPNSTIYISSILKRKDNSLLVETTQANSNLVEMSKNIKGHFINHNINIETSQMYDPKHLNRFGFRTLMTNIRYVLYGFLPSVPNRWSNSNTNNNRDSYQRHRYPNSDR